MLTPTFKANNDFPNSVEEIKHQAVIYPNPFTDFLYLDKPEDIEVRDVLGKLIFYENGINNIHTLDWDAGVYFIFLKNKKLTLKVIKYHDK